MADKVQFVKPSIDRDALLIRLLVIVALSACFYPVDTKFFWILGLIAYFFLTMVGRILFVPGAAFESVKKIREGKFVEAIPVIQQVIDYYTKNRWVDRYRFYLLTSSSTHSFWESHTCNLAYCYMQLGDVEKAKGYYNSVLDRCPDNINAKNMLHMMRVVENQSS